MYRIDEWRQKIKEKEKIRNYKHLDKKLNIIENDADFNDDP